jgi:polyhydroxyalkanoate synthesis regulator protein
MRTQQEAFFKAMTGGLIPGVSRDPQKQRPADDLDTIKAQLAEMQDKLSKMGK